jgi:hypothetical protein
MSAESCFLRRVFRISYRYTCEFSARRPQPGEAVALVCEWTPHAPRRPSPRELEAYRAARHAFVTELAAAAGIDGAVAVIEA